MPTRHESNTSESTATLLPRILVVEDDARWAAELLRVTSHRFYFARDLAEGISLIDRRRKWYGAIFDRYLLEGAVPFSAKSIRQDGGFILALEFIRHFPAQRVCVVSGDPDIGMLPSGLRQLMTLDNIRFIFKERRHSQRLALQFLETGRVDTSLLDSILPYLLLEPNFLGLGLNLSEIIRRVRAYTHARRHRPSQ